MAVTPAQWKRLKSNLLFVAGLVWISYFAFFNPTGMNPYFMVLCASALFGPAVITRWQSEEERDGD